MHKWIWWHDATMNVCLLSLGKKKKKNELGFKIQWNENCFRCWKVITNNGRVCWTFSISLKTYCSNEWWHDAKMYPRLCLCNALAHEHHILCHIKYHCATYWSKIISNVTLQVIYTNDWYVSEIICTFLIFPVDICLSLIIIIIFIFFN